MSKRFLVPLFAAYAIGAAAHESNFGLSPDTLFKRGWLVETSLEYRLKESLYEGSRRVTNAEDLKEEEWETHTEIAYGWDQHTTVGVFVPYRRISESGPSERETSEGFGDPGVLFKRRFFKADFFGGSDYLSLIGEYRLGTSSRTDDPPLGSGHDSYLVGLGYAHVSQRWAWWLDAGREAELAPHGNREGDLYILNAILGYRARVAELDELDAQWLLEWNVEIRDRTRERGSPVESSGGTEHFLSPGVLLGYWNVLFKAGVQIPVYRHLHGRQLGTDVHAKVMLEFTF